jgi:hypothetical protein
MSNKPREEEKAKLRDVCLSLTQCELNLMDIWLYFSCLLSLKILESFIVRKYFVVVVVVVGLLVLFFYLMRILLFFLFSKL